MKSIVAIIKPFKLEEVQEALKQLQIEGMTVSEVSGLGHQQGHAESYRTADYIIDMVPKLKIEVTLEDELEPAAVKILADAARTGKLGDGKIFVAKVDDAVRIRTGERGSAALSLDPIAEIDRSLRQEG